MDDNLESVVKNLKSRISNLRKELMLQKDANEYVIQQDSKEPKIQEETRVDPEAERKAAQRDAMKQKLLRGKTK